MQNEIIIENRPNVEGDRDVKVVQGAGVSPEPNPFEGLEENIDPSSVPDEFATLFNKYIDYEIDGFVYRYKEPSMMDLLSYGVNPIFQEALDDDSLGADGKVSEAAKDRALAQMMDAENVAQSKLHRDKVLLRFLVSVSVGGKTLEMTPQLIYGMREGIRDDLYMQMLTRGAEEITPVRRFPEEPEEGQDDSTDSVSAS